MPGEGVFDAKVDGVDEQVGDQKEEISAAKAGQQMVENIPHRPGIFIFLTTILETGTYFSAIEKKSFISDTAKGGICIF